MSLLFTSIFSSACLVVARVFARLGDGHFAVFYDPADDTGPAGVDGHSPDSLALQPGGLDAGVAFVASDPYGAALDVLQLKQSHQEFPLKLLPGRVPRIQRGRNQKTCRSSALRKATERRFLIYSSYFTLFSTISVTGTKENGLNTASLCDSAPVSGKLSFK